MLKQVFRVRSYWEVIVYWNVDYDLFYYIEEDLLNAGISNSMLRMLWLNMYYGKAKAVTYSSTRKHLSIVLFNRHSSIEDYLDSIVHEVEHIKQTMLKAYDVEDKDEPPAYTVGFLFGRMWKVFRKIVRLY